MCDFLILKCHRFLGASLLVLVLLFDNALATELGVSVDKSVSEADLKINFKGVDGELLENINRHVRLVARLKSPEPLLSAERRRLQNRVIDEVKAALEPYGYYHTLVTRELKTKPNTLVYQVELREPVLVNKVDVQLNEGAKLQPKFVEWLNLYPLSKGQTLRHPSYERAKKTLLSTALRLGYFDARFSQSELIINEVRTLADIVLTFDSGPRYVIGEIAFDWRSDKAVIKEIKTETDANNKGGIDRELLNTLIRIKPGEYFNADDLSQTQRALLATPYFVSVDVQAKDTDAQSTTVPINIALTLRKRKSYSVEAGLGTDTGVRGGLGYENRRINSKGHNLSLRLGGSQIRRSANVNYRIPLARKESDSLDFFASLAEESGDSRDFTSTRIGTQLSIEWRNSFLKYGLVASRERSFRQVEELASALANTLDGASPLIEEELNTELLMPSFSWQRTKSDDLTFPSKGWSAEVIIRGASENVGSDIDLFQAIISGNSLYPVANGRLKLRFKLATSLIDDPNDLPESLGFLAGGDDSIRGYAFESIGALRNGEISVAENLIIASIEYQHPIRKGLALAAFFDIGDAFDSDADLQKGTGLGLRWRLPFGALRLDVASALDLEGSPLRLHFGFGTDL